MLSGATTMGATLNIAVFGSFGNRMLAPGWTKESAVALIGSGRFDLTQVEAGGDARFTAVAVLGSMKLIVDEGTQVTMTGFSLFGSRNVEVTPAGGPSIRIRAIAVLGSVNVELAEAD